MNVSNEQLAAEAAIARVLRATRANDVECAPARHPRQTSQCPNIARFAAVYRRSPDPAQQAEWTEEEKRHTRNCAFCQSLFSLFAAASIAHAAAVAHEDTVTGLDTSQETQAGITARAPKKSGSVPKPPAPRADE